MKITALLSGINFNLMKDRMYIDDIGGFIFTVNINNSIIEIPFDFTTYTANITSGGDLLITSGDELDECYHEEYKNLGISIELLSAKLLASAVEINEFHINFVELDDNEYEKIYIKEIVFEESNLKYQMNSNVVNSAIFNFNEF